MIEVDPLNKEAFYNRGVIAWTKWYPALMTARASLRMTPEAPGPLPSAKIRADLQARFGDVLYRGMADLKHAIELDPEYDDAMAYLNLLIRERADLRDTKEEYDADIQVADEWLGKTIHTKKMKAQRAEDASTNERQIRQTAAEMERRLLLKADPVYPPRAVEARIQGVVRFNAIIGKDGHVDNLQLVSGHPLLVGAATDAARQYVFESTLANGEPIRVITTIEIRFVLK
jgi:TonB family protein